MSLESLRLFQTVPVKGDRVGQYALLQEYGVLVTGGASYDLLNILRYLKETGVGIKETNSSFYSDWATIRNLSDFEMLRDQLLHYFSTYGLEYFGVDSVREGLVYIPNTQFNTPVHITLKVIDATSPWDIIERCFKMLNSGMAMNQATVNDILAVLAECNYSITGEEVIANKEAQILFYELSGKLPVESNVLFRYLVYYFSGSTMVINDKKTKDAILASGKPLPFLDLKRMVSLSQSFNRHKELWMCMKAANKANRGTVNQISKLSKQHHVPMPENVLNGLTSRSYSTIDVRNAAAKSSTFQIVRALNAILLRETEPEGSVFRIRNSKLWTSNEAPQVNKQITTYKQELFDVLRSRLANVVAYCEDIVDYSIPTSEKSFVGNIPEGTILRIQKSKDTLLIGVHWDDPYTDLDLRADSASFSLGWNTNLRSVSRSIMHSGDMTRAPKPYGASEWIYFSSIAGSFSLKLNLYSGYDFSKKFKFIVGKTNKVSIEKGYTIAPEEVLCATMVPMEEKQMYLGIVYPERDATCIFIGTANSGKSHVGRFSWMDDIQQSVMQKRINSAVRLSDIVHITNNPAEATVDLSLANLTKDSFLNLFK